MPPLVSVIIPCYGQAHFLASSIGSVLAQTYRSFELIVVNDGSPDTAAMVQVVTPFLDRLTYLAKENGGVASARNAGLAISKGEFAVFLDADDRLLPNALEAGAAALAARPSLGLVWGLRNLIDVNGLPVRHHVGMNGTPERYIDLLQTNIVGPPVSVMWRRSALEAVGSFSRTITHVEDYEAYLRVARQYEIHCHGATVAEYRVHGANMSGNNARMLSGILEALHRQLEWIGGDADLLRAVEAGRRDAGFQYDWSPGFDQVRALAKDRQWLRAWAAAAVLFGRYPVRTAPALLRGARKIAGGVPVPESDVQGRTSQ